MNQLDELFHSWGAGFRHGLVRHRFICRNAHALCQQGPVFKTFIEHCLPTPTHSPVCGLVHLRLCVIIR